jgi:glycosyltransferase 2 family protein
VRPVKSVDRCAAWSRSWLVKSALKLLISALLIGYLLFLADGNRLMERLVGLSPWFVLLAAAYYGVCQWLSAWRWQILLGAKGIHVPIGRLFNFYLIGMFFNNFLPGGFGGDAVKTLELYRVTGRGNQALASVFLERFTGLVGLGLIAVFAVVASLLTQMPSGCVTAVSVSAILLLGGVALLPILPQTIPEIAGSSRFVAAVTSKLGQCYEAVIDYRAQPVVLGKAILLSLIIQLLFAGYYALAAWALEIPISLLQFVILLPPITLATLIPLSWGGLGIRETFMAVLFAELGISLADVLAVSLAVFVLNMLLSLWGGLLVLFRRPVAAARAPWDACEPSAGEVRPAAEMGSVI